MKLQIVAVAVFVMSFAAIVNAQAMGLGPVGPPSFCQIYSNIVISEATKINTPDLPEDFKIRVAAVLEDSTKGCADCEKLLVWQNKMCVLQKMRSSLLLLQQIKTEADARLAATNAPAQ